MGTLEAGRCLWLTPKARQSRTKALPGGRAARSGAARAARRRPGGWRRLSRVHQRRTGGPAATAPLPHAAPKGWRRQRRAIKVGRRWPLLDAFAAPQSGVPLGAFPARGRWEVDKLVGGERRSTRSADAAKDSLAGRESRHSMYAWDRDESGSAGMGATRGRRHRRPGIGEARNGTVGEGVTGSGARTAHGVRQRMRQGARGPGWRHSTRAGCARRRKHRSRRAGNRRPPSWRMQRGAAPLEGRRSRAWEVALAPQPVERPKPSQRSGIPFSERADRWGLGARGDSALAPVQSPAPGRGSQIAAAGVRRGGAERPAAAIWLDNRAAPQRRANGQISDTRGTGGRRRIKAGRKRPVMMAAIQQKRPLSNRKRLQGRRGKPLCAHWSV